MRKGSSAPVATACRSRWTRRAVRSQCEYDYIVDAIGCDPCSFLSLLPSETRSESASISEQITYDSRVDGTLPRLHLPILSAMAQGPGFPNLMPWVCCSEPILRHPSKLILQSR
jgi:hypothetical protein